KMRYHSRINFGCKAASILSIPPVTHCNLPPVTNTRTSRHSKWLSRSSVFGLLSGESVAVSLQQMLFPTAQFLSIELFSMVAVISRLTPSERNFVNLLPNPFLMCLDFSSALDAHVVAAGNHLLPPIRQWRVTS